MKVKVLGCSGGIGAGLDTTSILLGADVLIDAGTGLCKLDLRELRKIRHIFITHSHLDHITGIPLLVDTIFDSLHESLDSPLTVYGSHATLTAIRKHIFNDTVWPDFSRLPNREQPVMQFKEIQPGERIAVSGMVLEMIPVNHVVPAVGYRVETGTGVFAFSGDTTTNDSFWDGLNRYDQLDLLIVESAFPNSELHVCRLAYHYCPDLLAADLKKLKHQPSIYVTHLKPGCEARIIDECRKAIQERTINQLSGGELFDI